MSTNATIAVKTRNTYRVVYVHYDGYPEHMLEALKNFNTRKKANDLISLGDMSFVGNTLEECKKESYYYKAWNVAGFEHMQKEIMENEHCFDGCEFKNSVAYQEYVDSYEYAYLFDGENWVISGGYMNK